MQFFYLVLVLSGGDTCDLCDRRVVKCFGNCAIVSIAHSFLPVVVFACRSNTGGLNARNGEGYCHVQGRVAGRTEPRIPCLHMGRIYGRELVGFSDDFSLLL